MSEFSLPEDCKELEVKDPYMRSFMIETKDGPCRVNVWRNDKNPFFTVGTHIKHPKKGKNQLYRKFCSKKEVEELLKNPRKHTGKGCR